MAAAACLRLADAGVIGERVDLPDDRDLRPMPVVGRGLPDGEQPGAECFHHRVVDVAEHVGELFFARTLITAEPLFARTLITAEPLFARTLITAELLFARALITAELLFARALIT